MPTLTTIKNVTVYNRGISIFGETWTGVRDGTSGLLDATSDGTDFGVSQFVARGATWYMIHRVFAYFDTSGISIAPSSATLKIYGRANVGSHDNADFFVVKGTQGTGTPSASDFDEIGGWDTSTAADGDPSGTGSGAGDQESNVTKYTAEWVNGTTAWDESDYNELTLNATARADMASGTELYICIIESVHDLRDVSENHNSNSGMYFTDDAGKETQIDYTAGVASAADNAIFFGTNF